MTTAVKLKFVDVLGLPLDDQTVTVDVFSLDNTIHFQAVVPVTNDTDATINLEDCPLGTYRFQLSPTNYQVIQFFLNLPPGGTFVRDKPCVFPVDPDQVIDIGAPPFGNLPAELQDFLNAADIQKDGGIVPDGSAPPLTGDDLYSALPPKLKAALLNLFLKSSNTTLPDGSTCFSHLHILREQDQDRLFATADAALLQGAINSKKLHSVDFSLHKEILEYKLFSSFKTFDSQGNLQLTFSQKNNGNDLLVDMDIDEAQGIAHVFEVIHNVFAGLTNPYNVREILMAAQGLRPLYSFVFPQRKTATVAAGVAA
ncbi:MAG TPA: hypothetical protein VJA94_23245 [Candidatus Angelobacter sp.]